MYYFSHHNEESETYDSHVFTFRGTDFCIGCFTNKLFLTVIFPVLFFTLMTPRYEGLLWATAVLYSVSVPQYIYEYILGRKIWNKPLRYTAALFQLVAVSLTALSLSTLQVDVLLLLTVMGIIPQYIVYVYKIVTQREFTHKLGKFIIRIGFVTSLFFGLGLVATRPLTALISLALLFYLFVRLRALSTYRVEGDFYVFHRIADGRIRERLNGLMEGRGGLLVLSALFLLGVVSLSLSPAPTCTKGIGLLASFPFLSRGFSMGDVDNFCENCGTKRRGDSIFCQNCGTRFAGVQPAGKAMDVQEPRAMGDKMGSGVVGGTGMAPTGGAPGVQGGYNQGGYNQGGYNQGGYNQRGYNQRGYTGGPHSVWTNDSYGSRSYYGGTRHRRSHSRRRRSHHNRSDDELLCWICCFIECCMD